MQIIQNLTSLTKTDHLPIVLTIGNFDGVHLGHKAVLRYVVQEAKKRGGISAALTFSNHPSTLFFPHSPTPLLTTPWHKLQLFEQLGIDLCIQVPFSPSLAKQTAEEFLRLLKSKLSFSLLILGTGATLGCNRQGNQTELARLGQALGFSFISYQECTYLGEKISSSSIRSLIKEGALQEAEKRLGRPWSIISKVVPGKQLAQKLSFPTANLNVDSLVLPPQGVYAAHVFAFSKKWEALVNLGIAPSFNERKTPLLEAHLLNFSDTLYEERIEVIPTRFIRKEQIFSSKEQLKAQIQKDLNVLSQTRV